MSTSFTPLVNEFKKRTQFQQIPIQYTDADYEGFILSGVETLYIDLGNDILFKTEVDQVNYSISRDINVSEKEYILNAAEISFFETIQNDVNTIVGYTTDALSITNADKPYSNLAEQIQLKKDRNIELFPKIRALSS
jgi:hypothetical protein